MTLRRIAVAVLAGIVLAGCAPATTKSDPGAVGAAPPVAHEDCAIPGDMAHWQADFCMAQAGTDDVIAAGPCLQSQAAVRFRSACAGKRHYKSRMCELAIANGSRADSVEACVADPEFVGVVVRNGGA